MANAPIASYVDTEIYLRNSIKILLYILKSNSDIYIMLIFSHNSYIWRHVLDIVYVFCMDTRVFFS